MATKKAPALAGIYIKKIELTNYRGFYGGDNVIDLQKNTSLAVLGENGSGKSSLYFALKDFFTLPKTGMDITKVPYRNIFAKTANTGVKIDLSDGTSYEWSNTADTLPSLVAKGIDTTSGFIDYKSLLQTYYSQQKEASVDVFEFLVTQILRNIKPLSSTKTIGTLWDEIFKVVPDKKKRTEVNAVKKKIEAFNTALGEIINGIPAGGGVADKKFEEKTQEILDLFDLNVKVELNFGGISYNSKFASGEDLVTNTKINLTVDFYKAKHDNHHLFLNEARLSAIAVSLFFASFQIQPAGKIKFIVLDDVLIGLDMQNRMPVLDILEKYFSDFQIFLFTFDELWFTSVKIKFPKFQKFEIHSVENDGHETITIKAVKSYMEKAEYYLAQGDKEEAGNFIRKTYERTIRDFCDRKGLKTKFQYDQGRIQANEFWSAIVAKGNKLITPALKTDIENCQKTVSNPLSHAGIVGVTKSEIKRAIDKVKLLIAELNAIK